MEAPSAIFSASLFVGSFMKSHYTKCADERQSFRRSELRDCKTVPSLTSPDSALYDQAIAGTGSQLHFLSTGWLDTEEFGAGYRIRFNAFHPV